jgi:hypothetical protein
MGSGKNNVLKKQQIVLVKKGAVGPGKVVKP